MSKKKVNIFIVEDNKVFALALKADIETAFANRAVQVQSFETGETCMKHFKQQVPDIVILDYHLDSSNSEAANGIKVLDWIKMRDDTIHVIMLTATDNIEVALKSFKHGATDYIVKTEPKFRKINNALFNLFATVDARNEARKYRHLGIGSLISVSILVGGMIAIHIFAPSVF